ncbi:MAG: tRNA (adenosine(37)-N6)-dimethylallyltransferase MiaA [Defluviitaleaceae bacterium]|nr:tRNA (adenosine(37)-N6)-dimethylallyltransferase MiaA [Defluviitaleaceae bacterium]
MKPLIVIAGPTATGKSAVAIELAQMIGGEIVSADSMQVYKYMDIGTAKPTAADLAVVKHHMIDLVEPDYEFNAAIFYNKAKAVVKEIHGRGKTPIIAGGTGFYINALLHNNEFESYENKNNDYRNELYKENEEVLFAKLLETDPEYAQTTHIHNIKRVVRALEYYYQTGEKFSEYNRRNKENRASEYDFKFYILTRDREKLYNGINKRVDKMIELGLIDEVKSLLERGYTRSMTSMQGLGYKEICAYLNGENTRNNAIDMVKQGTRRFAKRQITWFKNQTEGIWLDVDSQSITSLARTVNLQGE